MTPEFVAQVRAALLRLERDLAQVGGRIDELSTDYLIVGIAQRLPGRPRSAIVDALIACMLKPRQRLTVTRRRR